MSLKPADHGVVHPDLPGIRTRRNPFAQPQEFADFTRDARASTHRLMEVPTGQEMLTDINNKTEQLNPGATGTPQKPLTAVDIHSGNKMTHNPRVSAFASDADKLAESRPAYRFDGKPGTGAASTVKYNPNGGKIDSTDVALRPGDFRANSLGHEMVHAHRAAHGVQVAPLEASKHAQHPALKPFEPDTPGGVNYPKEIINQHALLKEEFETVGLQRTPGNPDAPTENKIRKELGMPPRKDYSGAVPGAPITRSCWRSTSTSRTASDAAHTERAAGRRDRQPPGEVTHDQSQPAERQPPPLDDLDGTQRADLADFSHQSLGAHAEHQRPGPHGPAPGLGFARSGRETGERQPDGHPRAPCSRGASPAPGSPVRPASPRSEPGRTQPGQGVAQEDRPRHGASGPAGHPHPPGQPAGP
ncbi:M91 family zinc metallopeptidase [Cystobacter fuscus]